MNKAFVSLYLQLQNNEMNKVVKSTVCNFFGYPKAWFTSIVTGKKG